MSKKNKLIIIGAVVLVVIIVLSAGIGLGWFKKHPGSIKFKAEVMGSMGGVQERFVLIESREKLERLYGEEAYKDKYNDSFFEKKSLIMIDITEPDSSYDYTVNDVFIEDNILYVDLIRSNHGLGFQALWGWGINIEVKKQDIQDVTRIEKIITEV